MVNRLKDVSVNDIAGFIKTITYEVDKPPERVEVRVVSVRGGGTEANDEGIMDVTGWIVTIGSEVDEDTCAAENER
jgi:hypothetical protein